MADEYIQRAYRAGEPPVRSASGGNAGAAAGGDPLAELARLIGQNDPFAEYGRDNGRGAPLPQQSAHDLHAAATAYVGRYAAPEESYVAPPVPSPPFAAPPAPPPSHYAQQGYSNAAYARDPYAQDAYAQDPYAQGIVPGQGSSTGYEQAPFFPNNPQSTAEDEHYYDDVPPRRRVGVLAIAAIFALAVVGTAGAFGYRTLFGGSGAKNEPPPVIKADATPSKVVPAAQSKDPQNSKLIYDRVNNQNEKVVSREEQPLDIKDRPVGSVMPSGQASAQQASIGSGVIGGVEPKKVHTIAIHPAQPTGGVPEQTTESALPSAPARAQPTAPPVAARVAEVTPSRQTVSAEPRVARAAPPAPSNAPLSLNPNATAPAAPVAPQRPARMTSAPQQIAPARTAAPTQTASVAAGSGGYAVQIVSRHNEADAQASFQSLQSKFPQQLGGRTPLIRRVDLGAKGIYYRAMVGPFGNSDEASQLCSNLKAAGGECLVQRI